MCRLTISQCSLARRLSSCARRGKKRHDDSRETNISLRRQTDRSWSLFFMISQVGHLGSECFESISKRPCTLWPFCIELSLHNEVFVAHQRPSWTLRRRQMVEPNRRQRVRQPDWQSSSIFLTHDEIITNYDLSSTQSKMRMEMSFRLLN